MVGTQTHCHKVYAGTDPRSDKDVIITTWQSVYKLPKDYTLKDLVL